MYICLQTISCLNLCFVTIYLLHVLSFLKMYRQTNIQMETICEFDLEKINKICPLPFDLEINTGNSSLNDNLISNLGFALLGISMIAG